MILLKKILFLVLLTADISVYAENDTTSANSVRFSLGLSTGIIWNPMNDQKDNFNLNFGLINSVSLGKNASIQLGFLFDLFMYKIFDDQVQVASFNYLRIPISFKYIMIKRKKTSFYPIVGFQPGIPVYSGNGINSIHSKDYNDSLNYSLLSGLGISHVLNKKNQLGIDFHFYHFANKILYGPHYIFICNTTPCNSYNGSWVLKVRDVIHSRNYFAINLIYQWTF